MSLTPSNMLKLGTLAPDFKLYSPLSNKKVTYADIAGSVATVVMFICNHCPFVKHLQQALVQTANYYLSKGIGFVAVNANDSVNYPEDAPDKMCEVAKAFNYPFEYLFDETQSVARAYQASCTPDFFVFNEQRACVYRGRFDDSTPGNGLPVTGKDLHQALDALLEGKQPAIVQYPSFGCNIKWRLQ